MSNEERTDIPPPPYPKVDAKKKWGKFFIKLGLGVVIGGLLGFAYYQIVGCPTGGCTLTSSPEITTGYGMLLGAVASISA